MGINGSYNYIVPEFMLYVYRMYFTIPYLKKKLAAMITCSTIRTSRQMDYQYECSN